MYYPIRFFHIFTLLFFLSGSLLAQEVNIPEENRFVYSKEYSGGLVLHSRGWGAEFRFSRYNSNFKKYTFEFDLVSMKHPQELSIPSSLTNDSKSYIFGKKNYLIVLRTGIGSQLLVFDKAPKNGVEIHFSYSGGLSTELLKPVYLEIEVEQSNFGITTVTEKYDENKHDQGNIVGGGPFLSGFNELKILPLGAYLKAGLNFDWSADDELIKSIEVGTTLDAFLNKVPIMTEKYGLRNKQTFISFYATISFGKKS